jgi:hypothetical protein
MSARPIEKRGSTPRSAQKSCHQGNAFVCVQGEIIMQRVPAHALAMGLVISAFAAVQLVPQASSQTGDGWTMLVDGKTMGDWNQVGETARLSPTREPARTPPIW